jgi:putative endopeptidase
MFIPFYFKRALFLPILSALTASYLAGCSPRENPQTSADTFPEQLMQASQGVGINLENLDQSVSPCEDFYQFANGNWIRNNPIPPAESRWGSFNELADKNNAVLLGILTRSAADQNAPKGSNTQKVGDYFFSGMDTVGIERAGLAPLKAELDRIKGIKDLKGLQQVLARHKMLGTGALFSLFVAQDRKISTEYALYAGQSGLGLPERDYYLNTDVRSQTLRTQYEQHVQQVFALLGDDAATARRNAQQVMAMETRLAQASMDRVTRRDPYATYHKMTVQEARKLTPNLDWALLLQETGVPGAQEIIITQPEFFQEANLMLKQVPLPEWQTYLRWHLVRSTAPALPQAFVEENFNFFNRTLAGAQAMQPRWKRVLSSTDNAIGEALGELYVKEAFSPEAKEKALEMVNNLRSAFRDHINALAWMSDDTKKEALRKLESFSVKIGYPDQWKSYEGLEIDRGPFVQNVLRAREFAAQVNMAKLGNPVARHEWGMTPPTVNAYYNSSLNEIVFPAGILQPPFFDPKADDAVNYGGIGAVIGHEFTHGFDDRGRQSDAEGNLRDWWTAEDNRRFEERAEVVVEQYSRFSPVDSVFLSGKLTLGENIADIGGLSIAYTALQKALRDKGAAPKIDGFTPEQRFFLSWGQIWRTNAREEYLRRQVLTDTHSPGRFRVNGPLTNMPEFHEAFKCRAGSKMFRPENERAKIW